MFNQRGIALTGVLVVVLIIIIVVGGYYILNLNQTKTNLTQDTKSNMESAPQQSHTPTIEDKQSQLLRTCGDFPEEVINKVNRLHYDVVKGPVWTDDCKYIVWSKWISGTGGPGIEPQAANTSINEGVFLYIPKSKEYKTIYKPKQNNETPELIDIKGSVVEYKTSNNSHFFNLETNSPIK